MRKYRLFALALVLMLLLAGCSLAQPEREGAVGREDKMVGVLITFEPLDLFDIERYVSDNADAVLSGGGMISQPDAEAYTSCLFAEKDEQTGDYRFPNITGLLWLNTTEEDADGRYQSIQATAGLIGTKNHYSVTDSGESCEFAGTVYFAPEKQSGIAVFYTNALYQTADGRVYTRGGQGVSTNCEDGSKPSMTTTLSQSMEETENGEKKTYSTEYAITMQLAAEPDFTDVYWMRDADGIVRHVQYPAGAFPTELDAQDADFLLITETAVDGSARRTLYAPDTSEQPHAFCRGENGVLLAQYATVTWAETP